MLLSIIIPVYNAEKYIEKCVNSIITQVHNMEDIELIIINDGSKDLTSKILNKLAAHNKIINLYEQENGGEGFTRNRGLEKARGEFIWFIDADDFIDDGIVSKLHNIISTKTPDVILFGIKRITEEGLLIAKEVFTSDNLSSSALLEKKVFSNSVCNKVFRLNSIKENSIYFDEKVKTATDFDFSFRALYFSKKIIVLEDIPYNYIVNPDSVSNIRSEAHLNKLATHSVIVGKNINSFLNENPSNISAFKPWLNNYLFGLLFSLFRFNYKTQFIKNTMKTMEMEGLYTVNSEKMDLKRQVFMFVANRKPLFILCCKINRMLKVVQ